MLKKYSIAALFSLLLIFTAFAGGGFAETTEPVMSPETATALAEVYKVNNEIYTEIAKVQLKAEEMYANYLVEAAKTTDTQKKAEAWNKYDVKVEEEIEKLQEKTESITAIGIDKAAAAGLIVEVEWINVKFADRERMIDPIKVMDW